MKCIQNLAVYKYVCICNSCLVSYQESITRVLMKNDIWVEKHNKRWNAAGPSFNLRNIRFERYKLIQIALGYCMKNFTNVTFFAIMICIFLMQYILVTGKFKRCQYKSNNTNIMTQMASDVYSHHLFKVRTQNAVKHCILCMRMTFIETLVGTSVYTFILPCTCISRECQKFTNL